MKNSSIAGAALPCNPPLTKRLLRALILAASLMFTVAGWAQSVDTSDVIATQRHFLGIVTVMGCELAAADCASPHGQVTTVDVIAIQRYYLGLSTGTGDVGVVIPGCGGTRVYGDVVSTVSAPPVSETVSLPIDNIPISNNMAIPEPVTTSTIVGASTNYTRFQGNFTFDETIVTFANPPVAPAGLTATNWSVAGHILSGPGPIRTLRISAFTTGSALDGTGTQTLFNLRMLRVSSNSGDVSALHWLADPYNFIFGRPDLGTGAPNQVDGQITITP